MFQLALQSRLCDSTRIGEYHPANVRYTVALESESDDDDNNVLFYSPDMSLKDRGPWLFVCVRVIIAHYSSHSLPLKDVLLFHFSSCSVVLNKNDTEINKRNKCFCNQKLPIFTIRKYWNRWFHYITVHLVNAVQGEHFNLISSVLIALFVWELFCTEF